MTVIFVRKLDRHRSEVLLSFWDSFNLKAKRNIIKKQFSIAATYGGGVAMPTTVEIFTHTRSLVCTLSQYALA